MIYENIQRGIFQSRPNRFIAHVVVNGKTEICHVKNTGRCKELLISGVIVYVQSNDNPNRKTKFSLIAVQKGDRLINMDSQIPNKVVLEWILQGNLFNDIIKIKPESTYKNSRFDLYVETETQKAFVEVKGVTLEKDAIAMFPDAPTLRGLKHVTELIDAKKNGYDCYIIFVIQMDKIKHLSPNYTTHREFGRALELAQLSGVNILAYECDISPGSIAITKSVPVILGENI